MSRELSRILREEESSLEVEAEKRGERRENVEAQAKEVYEYFSDSIYRVLMDTDYSDLSDLKEAYSRVDDIIYDALGEKFGEAFSVTKNFLAGLKDVWFLKDVSNGEDVLPTMRVLGARSRVVSVPALIAIRNTSGCPFHEGALNQDVLDSVEESIRRIGPNMARDEKGALDQKRSCAGMPFYKDFLEKITAVYDRAQSQIQE